jgi:hypothetical protein
MATPIIFPTRSLEWPHGRFRMNPRSWQARGLIAWYPMLASGSKLFDLSPRGNHGDLQAAASIEWSGQLGQPVLRAKINSGSATNGARIPNIYGSATPEGTLLLYCRNSGNSSGAPVDYSAQAFTVHHYPFSGSDDGANVYCNALHSSNRVNVTDWLPNKSQWHWYVVRTKSGTNNWQWWQDGRKIAQQNGETNVCNVTDATRRVLGSNSSSSQGWGGFLAEARFYDRYWSDEEIIRLAKAPLERYELYQPLSSRTWFIPDQTQTVLANLLSVAPTIHQPQVNQGIAANLLSVAPTIHQPQVNQTVLANLLSSPVSLYAPEVLNDSIPKVPLALDSRSFAISLTDSRSFEIAIEDEREF